MISKRKQYIRPFRDAFDAHVEARNSAPALIDPELGDLSSSDSESDSESEEEDEVCPICQDQLDHTRISLDCGHKGSQACLSYYFVTLTGV